jgi:PAS domain S-box-containing protein
MAILPIFSCDKKIALKISLTYAVIALCWIFFSDQLLLLLARDPQELTTLQSIKGWFFVFFTALLLFFLFQKEIRKQLVIEILLRKNEARLNKTERIAGVGSWELDVGKNKLWWSDETYRLFGFTKGDVSKLFEKFKQSIHPEDKHIVAEMINRAIQEGAPLKIDYRIVLPNGDIRYLHEESQAVYDEALRQVTKRTGSVQDITQQKKLEESREALITELQKSLAEIKALKGILPLCSHCKKIRDAKGNWEDVDVYIYKHSEADISHSICPDCLKTHYPE